MTISVVARKLGMKLGMRLGLGLWLCQIQPLRFAGQGQPFCGFSVGYGLPFVQTVEYQYQGCWFVRDGYHRAFGLLSPGVERIPCLFIRARDAQQFGGTAAHFLRWEIIFGSRPPFLMDFLDDQVAATATRPLTGKVIRIAAQEFSVQL
jgi:hypothetical protein